jgi:anaerobic nitric oxide reductase transcription regulator
VGKSPVIQKLREEITMVSQSDLTVLIQGETGVGKELVQHYSWPGNVRELAHLLSRAALKAVAKQGNTSKTVIIDTSHMDIGDMESEPVDTVEQKMTLPNNIISLKDSVDQFQRELIEDSQRRHEGNLASAGRELGISRSNFYRLLTRLELR